MPDRQNDQAGNGAAGGQGALTPGHRREDMRLLEHAIRNNWEIPEAVYKAFPAEVVAIVANRSNPLRERIRAMELMTRMQGQVLGENQPTEPQQHLHLHAGANGECNGDGIDWTKQPPEVVFEAMKLAARARQISANGNGKVMDVKPENGDGKP